MAALAAVASACASPVVPLMMLLPGTAGSADSINGSLVMLPPRIPGAAPKQIASKETEPISLPSRLRNGLLSYFAVELAAAASSLKTDQSVCVPAAAAAPSARLVFPPSPRVATVTAAATPTDTRPRAVDSPGSASASDARFLNPEIALSNNPFASDCRLLGSSL